MPRARECACHAVIHVNLNRHSSTHPSEVLVETYLPVAAPPYVDPPLVFKQAKLWCNCTRTPSNCPPKVCQLVNQLYSGGYTVNVAVVVLWDWWVGDIASVPAKFGGAYGAVAEESWLSCFNCHFHGYNIWDVARYINATKRTLSPTQYLQHPDACQPCHGQPSTVYDPTVRQNVWAHNTYGGDEAWKYCGSCHSAIASVVSTSVHWGVGCRCHSVVHVGYVYGGQWLAGLWTYEGSGSGVETAPTIVKLARAYTQYNATGSVASLVGNITAKTPGRNIEVGLWDAYKNDFVSTLPLGVGPSRVWVSCFNCHFLSIDPSRVSNAHAIGYQFKVQTWAVEPSAYSEVVAKSSAGPSPVGLIAVVLLVGGLAALWVNRRVDKR
ncbi:hypothetical protein Pcal_1487 [Pyrobaculum calidifontis JCM 11548]|uniref:Uncharacterized protein n=1 Tax=Pyrobaculum calidifontis (strain DSM 21063 / JCM 11548 / VA1) TaxID=410359 RepID=A3MW89_PYRCJ|nr:hypothetical protein Pcal_1487 [Pyrobaculum calidifontis JCM 11548]